MSTLCKVSERCIKGTSGTRRLARLLASCIVGVHAEVECEKLVVSVSKEITNETVVKKKKRSGKAVAQRMMIAMMMGEGDGTSMSMRG